MSSILQTTLTDNYNNIYYPRSYSNLISRQNNNTVTVEDSLINLENKINVKELAIPFNTNINIIFQDSSLQLYKNNSLYLNNVNNNLQLNIGNKISLSTDGTIITDNLFLNNLNNDLSNKILVANNNNQIAFKNTNQIINEFNLATLDSPKFIGIPEAPTPEENDNSNKIATTKFISNITNKIINNTNLFHKDWGVILIKANSWSNELDEFQFYNQKILITDMKKEYQPYVRLIITDCDLENREKEAFYNLTGITTYDGYIIVRTQNKPSIDLRLYLKGI